MLRPPPPTPKAQFNTSGTSGNGKVQNISGEVNMYDSSDSEEDDSVYHDSYVDRQDSPMNPANEAVSEHPVRDASEQSPPTAQEVKPLTMPPWIDANGKPIPYNPEARIPELGDLNRRGRRHDFTVKIFGQEYRLDIALKETFPSDQGTDAWLEKEREFVKVLIQQIPPNSPNEQKIFGYLAGVVPNMIYPRLILYILAHLLDCASDKILHAFLDTLYIWQSFTSPSDPIGLLRNAQAIRMTLEMYREHIQSCDDGQTMAYAGVSDTKGLCAILTRDHTAQEVEACTGLVARSLVNLIQACVDYGSLDMDSKRRLVRTLTKLSKSSNEVPQALMLDNVSIGEYIAQGGFGSVHKGTWKDHKVAVKIVRARKTNVEELAKAAAREAVTCRQLVHPNVVPFYGVFREVNQDNSAVCLVSALMDDNLYDFLQKNLEDVQQRKGEHVDCVRLALDIAQGLEYMHEEGIVHSDLKSMNILMSANGRAFLADFGIAKSADTETKAQTTEKTNGTKFWMAPELFKDAAHATKASDIYAYGMVCYEMFSGLIPFTQVKFYGLPPSVQGVRPPFPESGNTPAGERGMNLYVWKWIEDCWAQEVKSRPSAKQVVQFYLGEVDSPEDPRGVDNIVSPVAKSSAESIADSFIIW